MRIPSALSLAVTSAASTASGAIVVFDINPDHTVNDGDVTFDGVNVMSFNLSNGGALSTIAGGNQNYAVFAVGAYYSSLQFNTGTYAHVRPAIDGDDYLRFLPNSTQIDGAMMFGVNPFSLITSFNLPNTDGTGYLGLELVNGDDTHYGWFEVRFTDTDPDDGTRDYTLTRFAFNDVAGQSILAGQTAAVPEASTLGLVGGLFGLVVAAHLRRRKAAKVAAPDSLLRLAGGCLRD